jgi:hypothetical protein
MTKPLNALFKEKNVVMHLYGLPGTYKTTFLAQIIQKKLEEGCEHVYLIDTGGNFPIIRLKSIKHLLQKMIVFHPLSLEEEVKLVDDLNIKILDKDSILLIDDIFRHTNLEDKSNIHLNSYILAQISSISKIIEFPVVLTNQARSFENKIRPFLHSLTSYYLDWHFLFEKSEKSNTIAVSLFKKDKYISQGKYKVNSLGFLGS